MRRKKFGSRMFGGKKYRFSRDFDRKLEAISFASQLRREGKLARVTPQKDMQGRRYYIVWVSR